MLAVAIVAPKTLAQEKLPLKLVKNVTLTGYTGEFDHFAADLKRDRMLVAAEDHATLEIFDLKSGDHLGTVAGFGAPHTILLRPNAKDILVTDSGTQMTAVLDADTYQREGSIPLTPGASSAGYDPVANVWYIVTGGKDVNLSTAVSEAVDPDTHKKLGELKFNDTHVEAMALEKHGDRLFINLAQTNRLAVVDRKTLQEIAEWPVPSAKGNAMVSFDEGAKRLYVVCRDAAMFVVMDSDTGKVISTATAPLRAGDEMMDLPTRRLYVPWGEGSIGMYDISNPDQIQLVAKVPSAPGAKTGYYYQTCTNWCL